MKVLIGKFKVKNIDEVDLKDLEESPEHPLAYVENINTDQIAELAKSTRVLAKHGADYKVALDGDRFPIFLKTAERDFNYFVVDKVASKIQLLNKMRQYYNEGNPNNGLPLLKIWLTRDMEIIFEFFVKNEYVDSLLAAKHLFHLPYADEFGEKIEPGVNYSRVFFRNWWD